ncbi:MAG TPA: hypothetical protein VKY74_04050, partial [Chloroflexia bacterium]|nr:hypothetical protein [Chloroflexia bacterium]
VRVPARAIADNAWQRFAFPPIAGSRGQGYYLELEQPSAVPGNAITAYWALQQGDPYPYGRATYDRAPLDGDLTFGLHYDPPPGALWADVAQTLAGQVPGRLLGLGAAAGLAGALALGLLLWGAAQGWWDRRPRRLAAQGALLAAVALAHGLVWLVVVPPWQGPDEFSHYAYSTLLAAGVSPEDSRPAALQTRDRIAANILAEMDRRNFTHMISWYGTPGGPAAAFAGQTGYSNSTMFLETRQPPLYYQVGAALLRAYAADPAGIEPAIGLWIVRGSSVLWSSAVVLLAWGCALLVAPGRRLRLLWLALPLTIALLPMRVFIDSMANNDVLAEVAVSAVALLIFAWLSRARPLGWGAVAGLAGGLLLSWFSLLTKASTALIAPVLWLVGLVGAGVLSLRGVLSRVPAGIWAALLALAILAAALVAQSIAVSFDRTGTAQAWFLDYGVRAAHTASPSAHSGSYVLSLPAQQPVYQQLDLPAGHLPYTITAAVWVRGAAGAPPGPITLTLDAREISIRATAGVLGPAATARDWQPLTATAVIPPGVPLVRVVLQAAAAAEADDARLQVTPPPGAALATPPAIRNPSMEEPGTQLRGNSPLGQVLARLPQSLLSTLIVDTFANPQTFDKAAVTQAYLENEYHSYWGWFGWLTVPLQVPDPQYTLWGLLAIGALAGWLSGWLLRPRLPAVALALGVITLVTLSADIAITVARQMMQWAMFALPDFPQGRYLFVLIIPTTWLLLVGLGRWPALLAQR